MHKIHEKILVFSLGIVAALIFLEIILRIFGFLHLKKNQKKLNISSNARVILCLGNSHTFGIGAPSGESYPDHLERILNKNSKDKKYLVINKGLIAENSAQILDQLKENIEKFKPNIIVLRCGTPNIWNFTKYNDYLKRKNKNRFSFLLRNMAWIENISLFKLYRLILQDLKNFRENALPSTTEILNKFLLDFGYYYTLPYTRQLEVGIKTVLSLYGKNIVKINPAELKESENWFKNQISTYPTAWYYYSFLGNILEKQNKYIEAVEAYKTAFLLQKKDEKNSNFNINSLALRKIYSFLPNKNIKNQIKEFFETQGLHATFVNLLKIKNNPHEIKNIYAWIESDLEEMISIIKSDKNNINLIMQDYPPTKEWLKEHAENTSKVLRKVAMKNNIAFIGQEKFFNELFRKYKNPNEVFYHEGFGIAGSHLNSLGYKITAQNIANKIIEKNW